MTKQKKSFLDRIVGSQENEEEITEIKETKNENKENKDEAEENLEQKNDNINWPLDEDKENDKEEGQLTVDVYQTKEDIVIKSIIGGVRPEDLDLSITNDMVKIKGKRTDLDENRSKDYYYQECFWGTFSRSIILPCDIRTEKTEAKMKNGILTIKLPKIKKDSSVKIKIEEEREE